MQAIFAARVALLLPAALFVSGSDVPTMGSRSMPSISAPDFDAAAEYRKGVEALKLQRYAEAKDAFQNVHSAAPDDVNTNVLLGITYMGLNDYKNARKFLERSVKLDSKLVVAHEQLGITYAKLGETEKAQAELATLKQLQATCSSSCPDADKLNEAVSSVAGAIGQPAAELKMPSELLFASARSGDTAYLEAVSLIHEKRYQEALTSLNKAKLVFGAHPDILTYLGFANRKLGRYDLAETYYREALAIAPNHREATEYYGELKVERGDLDGAKALLARLDSICTFGCAEADELRLWIKEKHAPAS